MRAQGETCLPKFILTISDRHLSPGGYFESHEMMMRLGNGSRDIPEDAPLALWCKHMRDAIVKMDRTLDPKVDDTVDLMRRVGFVDIVVRPLKIPLGDWESRGTSEEWRTRSTNCS